MPKFPPLDRRKFLARGASVGVGLAASFSMGHASVAQSISKGLRQRAAAKGIDFGYAVVSESLRYNRAYADAVLRDCSMIVPSYELQWPITEPEPFRFDYSAANFISQFAQANGLKLRGHAAAWHGYLPDWVEGRVGQPQGIDLLYRRVFDIVGQFRGRISEWDVVNEAIEPEDGQPDAMRDSMFYRASGPDYVAQCFRVAHAADPNAKLYYNDNDIIYAGEYEDRRRGAVLALLGTLKDHDVPVHGLGIQAHLKVGRDFQPDVLARFLDQAAALNLEIKLTEFDLNDFDLPADIPSRDQAIAQHATQVLTTALANPALKGIICWGVDDGDSWLNDFEPRRDGWPQRGLPLDENFRPKPLWHALAEAFDTAPIR